MGGLQNIVDVLRSLGDETRLRILHVLWRADPRRLTVGDLVAILRRPQPTVSRHLAQLRIHGLVVAERRGTERWYRLPRTQGAVERAVLEALQAWVPSTPEAKQDAQRLAAVAGESEGLTAPSDNATNVLHVDQDEHGEGEMAMTAVLHALSHPTRRRLLDRVGATPGRTLGDVAGSFESSRAAIGKHLAVLERAGLIVSRREGRMRRLYHNPLPVQLLYDRWTDRYSAPLARHVAAVKYAVEERADD